MNSQKIWTKLVEKGITTGEKPLINELHIPWYIRLMQGFAGWFAGLFFLGFFVAFFGFLFKTPSGETTILVGILCSTATYFLIRLQKNDFFDQLGIAVSFCGQLLVAIGLFFLLRLEYETSFFILAAYQLTLAWIIPQYIHRLLTTIFGLLALLIALNIIGLYGIGSAIIAVLFSFIWLKENSWNQQRNLWEPIAYGLAITVVFCSGILLTNKFLLLQTTRIKTGWLFNHAELVSSLLIALVFIGLVFVLLKENKVTLKSKTAILSFLAAAALVLMSFKIYGISTGLLVVIIGFARQRNTLIALGSFAVISFFSWYYYNLSATLLFKSIVLIILGIAMLIAWFVLNYAYTNDVATSNKSANRLTKLKIKPFTKDKYLGLVTVLIALVAINFNINSKQNLIKHGETLLFKLAPVDPRSIMQGDYMRLRFDLAVQIHERLKLLHSTTAIPNQRGFVIVTRDANNIATFIDLYNNQELGNNQYMIPYKFRKYQVIFTTDAFYFQEGKAQHFQQAEYGEFKLSSSGEMLLVNMLDKNFKQL